MVLEWTGWLVRSVCARCLRILCQGHPHWKSPCGCRRWCASLAQSTSSHWPLRRDSAENSLRVDDVLVEVYRILLRWSASLRALIRTWWHNLCVLRARKKVCRSGIAVDEYFEYLESDRIPQKPWEWDESCRLTRWASGALCAVPWRCPGDRPSRDGQESKELPKAFLQLKNSDYQKTCEVIWPEVITTSKSVAAILKELRPEVQFWSQARKGNGDWYPVTLTGWLHRASTMGALEQSGWMANFGRTYHHFWGGTGRWFVFGPWFRLGTRIVRSVWMTMEPCEVAGSSALWRRWLVLLRWILLSKMQVLAVAKCDLDLWFIGSFHDRIGTLGHYVETGQLGLSCSPCCDILCGVNFVKYMSLYKPDFTISIISPWIFNVKKRVYAGLDSLSLISLARRLSSKVNKVLRWASSRCLVTCCIERSSPWQIFQIIQLLVRSWNWHAEMWNTEMLNMQG